MRIAVKLLLAWFAFFGLAAGAWQQFAPRSFYEDFPGGGRQWVSPDGPYNEHLIRDYGGALLANAVVVAVAMVTLSRPLVVGTLTAQLVAAIPHYAFHASHLDGFSTADAIGQTATLTVELLLLGSLLVVALRRDPRERRRRRPPLAVSPVGAGQRRAG